MDEVMALPGARMHPAVNQIEISPFLPRNELTTHCQTRGVVVEAYSPLTKAAKLRDPRLVAMAHKYSVSPAQILIQWCLQRDLVAIPKSVNPGRIAENADTVTNFAEKGRGISAEDMAEMDGWDEHLVTGWDPTTDP
jgi:diketogulonate reductase-like aldo/keto reductase